MPLSLRSSGVLAALFLLGCGSGEQVLRREGDQTRIGRVVSGTAYAWYLRGQWYESAGKLAEAEYSYDQGASVDARSGTLYAALGRVRCLLDDPKTHGTFAEGMSRAQEKLPVLLEESACALHRGRTGIAIRASRDAVELAPSDEKASLALASALLASRDSLAAERVARGYRLYSGRVLERPARSVAPEHELPDLKSARKQVDDALNVGDLVRARNAGAGVVPSGEIALRAALLGKTELALEQAARTLTLDPTDFDANVAELIAQSQSPSPPPRSKTADPAALSELGVLALGLSVALYDPAAGRRIGSAFPESDSQDPLARELRRRLFRVAPEGTSIP